MPQSKSRKIAILGYRSVGEWRPRRGRLGAPGRGRACEVWGGAAMWRAGGARFVTSILSGGGGAFPCPRARRAGGGAPALGVGVAGPRQRRPLPVGFPAPSRLLPSPISSPPATPVEQAPGISTKETSPCDPSVCGEVKPFKGNGETSESFGRRGQVSVSKKPSPSPSQAG